MKTLHYTKVGEQLASTIEDVINDCEPLLITKDDDQAVVMMSLAEWNSLQETLYLLRDPANAKHLLNAVADFDMGKNVMARDILDDIDANP